MKPLSGTAFTTSPGHCQGFSLSKLWPLHWDIAKAFLCQSFDHFTETLPRLFFVKVLTTSLRHCQGFSLSKFWPLHWDIAKAFLCQSFDHFTETLPRLFFVKALTTSLRHCQGFSLSKLHCKWGCEKSWQCDCQVISSSLLQGISTCRQWKKKLTPVRIKDWPVYCPAGTSVDAVGPIWSQLQKQKQKKAHLWQVTEDLRADRCCPIKIRVLSNFLLVWILFQNASSRLRFTFWG